MQRDNAVDDVCDHSVRSPGVSPPPSVTPYGVVLRPCAPPPSSPHSLSTRYSLAPGSPQLRLPRSLLTDAWRDRQLRFLCILAPLAESLGGSSQDDRTYEGGEGDRSDLGCWDSWNRDRSFRDLMIVVEREREERARGILP
ncbi:hypothetical protein HNY73_022725 [Argiope bruennichi]|uniref:Uncharacterized protein n=1 Tax=Argiope bruennichi TaxID=94029 RepID=A0A8T0E5E8_ARGBR|nr:hypothetical protein HNY73_022725 [Argiope bruennichi]